MLPELSRSMLKNSLVLALFAAVTVAVVAITQQSTESRIVAEERAAQVRALGEILPAHSYDNALLDHVIYLNESLLGHRKDTPAYLASLNGQPAAVILQANAPDGYSGTIQLLIGIMADALSAACGSPNIKKHQAWATVLIWRKARGSKTLMAKVSVTQKTVVGQ